MVEVLISVVSAAGLRRRRCGGATASRARVSAVVWVDKKHCGRRAVRATTHGVPFEGNGTGATWNSNDILLVNVPDNATTMTSSSWSLKVQIFYNHPMLLALRRVVAYATIPAHVILGHCANPPVDPAFAAFPLRSAFLSLPCGSLFLAFRIHHGPSLKQDRHSSSPSSSSSSSPRGVRNSSTVATSGTLTNLTVPLPTPAVAAAPQATDSSVARPAAVPSLTLAETLGLAGLQWRPPNIPVAPRSLRGDEGASKHEGPSVSPLYGHHHLAYAQEMAKWRPNAS